MRREKIHITINPVILKKMLLAAKLNNIKISRLTEMLYEYFIQMEVDNDVMGEEEKPQ